MDDVFCIFTGNRWTTRFEFWNQKLEWELGNAISDGKLNEFEWLQTYQSLRMIFSHSVISCINDKLDRLSNVNPMEDMFN